MGRQTQTLPVDRGWAWVVLAGGVISGMLVSVGYVVGIFNVVFLEVFQRDQFTTSWIGSLSSSLVMLAGPLANYMSGKIGARQTVACGALIGTLGFVLASFSMTFVQLFISYGVIAGLGVGLCSLPCVIAIGNHFDKYRNLAYGIYNSSIGLGCVIFPFLVSASMEQYGWRGAMLILGGCCLNFLVGAAALRPADSVRVADEEEAEADDKHRHDSGHHSPARTDSLGSLPALDPLLSSGHIRPADDRVKLAPKPAAEEDGGSVSLYKSLFSLDIMSQSAVGLGSLTTVRSSHRHINSARRSRPQHPGRECGIHSAMDIPTSGSGSGKGVAVRKHESVYDISARNKQLLSPARFSQSHGALPQSSHECLNEIPAQLQQQHPLDSPLVLPRKPALMSADNFSVTSDADSFRHSQLMAVRMRDSQFFDAAVMMTSYDDAEKTAMMTSDDDDDAGGTWRDMLNPGLFGLCASQFLFSAGMSITYLHLPQYVISMGTSVMASSSLISVIGVCNVATRFLVGAATNLRQVDDAAVYIAMSVVAGVCLALAEVLCKEYATQVVFAGLFGFFANGYVSVMGPLTIKYVGLERLGPAYSCQMIVSGVAFFIGPPIAGLLYDFTRSYSYTFYFAGGSYVVGAISMIPAWIWDRRREKPTLADSEIVVEEYDGAST